jgi:hypothetical protein
MVVALWFSLASLILAEATTMSVRKEQLKIRMTMVMINGE